MNLNLSMIYKKALPKDQIKQRDRNYHIVQENITIRLSRSAKFANACIVLQGQNVDAVQP